MIASRVTIKIPRPLYERLQQIIEGSGFSSVTEFVIFVLRDLASSELNPVEADEDDDEPVGEADAAGERLTRQEIEAIRQRLRHLGYLGDD